jgi:ArsR family transcriptional regulator
VTSSPDALRPTDVEAEAGGARVAWAGPASGVPIRARRASAIGRPGVSNRAGVKSERHRGWPDLDNIRLFLYKKKRMKQPARSGQLQAFKAEFFKALAHPIRIRILELLVRGEHSVHELQAALELDQPTVSQQLAVLRAKNIVEARKQGTAVKYRVRDPSLRGLLEVTRRIFDNHLIGTQTMLRELRREARRR